MALANFMRLSLMKAAHADLGGAAWQEIRVAHRFRPTYAGVNVGHPSHFLWWGKERRHEAGEDTGPWRQRDAADAE
jgi:hypothetical protein